MANFLLADWGEWRDRHGIIREQVGQTCGIDAPHVFRLRADARGQMSGDQLKWMRDEVAVTRDYCLENRERVDTAGAEAEWVERHSNPEEYLREVEAAAEEGVVFVRHDGS